MRELLLPSTDRLVVLETVVFLLTAPAAVWFAWRWPHVRLLAVGVVTLTASLLGLRAVH